MNTYMAYSTLYRWVDGSIEADTLDAAMDEAIRLVRADAEGAYSVHKDGVGHTAQVVVHKSDDDTVTMTKTIELSA